MSKTSRKLAEELGIEVDERGCLPGTDLILARHEDRLELLSPGDRPGRGTGIDFKSIDVRPGSRSLSRRQPLARAFGACQTLVDATAGLGHDAFLLSCLGFQVQAVERSSVLAALLLDGLRRAENDPDLRRALGGRLEVIEADARNFLPALAENPDAIYIDTMFPPKQKRSALAKKPIRVVRELVGDDTDAGELFAVARARAGRRVVVKRSRRAPPPEECPDLSSTGKLARYDVYLS